ncbi:nuclear transport factor 2 family protein [Acidaminococcus fermentans]|uniref:nuclear transport factor 2 family protein n=1 Tax=Acidaminococcus fermentans TaxID=905 RepID=UPI003CFD3E68
MLKKKLLTLSLGLLLCEMLPGVAGAAPHFKNNKELAAYFWNQIFNEHHPEVIDQLTDDHYIQHNPGFNDGKQAFKDGITGFLKEFPESTAEIKHMGADGDLVFIHNHIKLNAQDRGQAAVDIFRIKKGKIVEHWDVIQDIPEKTENNNTMF